MANEAAIINNPDSTPGAVSTGYQLQNTGMVAARVGMDASVVTGGTGQCVLEISGPVDVNGVLYSINSAVTFALTVAGTYYIHLAGSGNNLTPTIGTGANTFDPDKNARYTDTGSYRVLNWVIYFDGTDATVYRLLTPEYSEIETRIKSAYIENLIVGEALMFATGDEIIKSWTVVNNGDSNIFTIRKPCTVYLRNNSTATNDTAAATINPGDYLIKHSTSPNIVRFYKSIDGTGTNIKAVLSDYETTPTFVTLDANNGEVIEVHCTYAEGMSVLDASKIVY